MHTSVKVSIKIMNTSIIPKSFLVAFRKKKENLSVGDGDGCRLGGKGEGGVRKKMNFYFLCFCIYFTYYKTNMHFFYNLKTSNNTKGDSLEIRANLQEMAHYYLK